MANQRPDPRVMLRALAWDVGVPILAYYVLHLAGASDWFALLAATSAAGLLVVWGAVRDRSVNLFASVMLVVFGIGLALAVVTGDERFLLLKASITTGVIGAAFLVAAAWGRPLTLSAAQRWEPARAAQVVAAYDADPRVRRMHLISSLVWGLGLLAEAAVRVPLIFLLPVSVMVGLSTAMLVVTIGGLVAWNGWYARRVGLATAHRAGGAAGVETGTEEAPAR